MSQLVDTELNGLLLIDKPQNMTSHNVVYHLRRILCMRRIGHAGTLDPLATGLLIMLIGKATKYSQYLMGLDKCYSGTMKFGETTDSYDSEGKIIETKEVGAPNIDLLRDTANTFIGTSEQIPPMFSAKKFNGRPLYKFARGGQVVERLPVQIEVKTFEISKLFDNRADFFVHCSKGTYIRVLVHDFGQKLGYGAHLCGLRRTAIGRFKITDALSLDKISELSYEEINNKLISPESTSW